MPNCLTSGVQRSTYQPNLRVGKPLFLRSVAAGVFSEHVVCTILPAEEASGKWTKMSMLTLLVAWRWRGKTRSANQRQKTEKPIVPSIPELATLVSFRRFPTQTTTAQQSGLPAHPLGPVVWLSGNASHLPQAFCLRRFLRHTRHEI